MNSPRKFVLKVPGPYLLFPALLALHFVLWLIVDHAVAKAGPGEGEPCYDAAVVADEGTAVDCAPGMRVEFGGMSDGVATVLCRCPSSP